MDTAERGEAQAVAVGISVAHTVAMSADVTTRWIVRAPMTNLR